jgi:hypothetical protein
MLRFKGSLKDESCAMLKFIYDNAVVIGVSLSFFNFALVLGIDSFDLAPQAITNALIAAVVCGITVLMTAYSNSKNG